MLQGQSSTTMASFHREMDTPELLYFKTSTGCYSWQVYSFFLGLGWALSIATRICSWYTHCSIE